jgi:hypothetical protein
LDEYLVFLDSVYVDVRTVVSIEYSPYWIKINHIGYHSSLVRGDSSKHIQELLQRLWERELS